jgi:L-threonylcarbamoyladenylate synthase
MTNLNIRKINPARPANNIINKARNILIDGGIIIAPTETRYGLLGRCDKMDTIKKIYDLKKREISLATAIFIHSFDEIGRLGIETEKSRKLSRIFLPGPLTLVLKNKSDFRNPIAVNNKIGLRFSSSHVISQLLDGIEFNLTATSANISGLPEAEIIGEICSAFGDKVDLYLDGGRLNSLPSTVIEFKRNECNILREGAISSEDINKGLSEV